MDMLSAKLKDVGEQVGGHVAKPAICRAVDLGKPDAYQGESPEHHLISSIPRRLGVKRKVEN